MNRINKEKLTPLLVVSVFFAGIIGLTFLSVPQNETVDIFSEQEAIQFISKQYPTITQNTESKVFSSKRVNNDWFVAEAFKGFDGSIYTSNCYIIINENTIQLQPYNPTGANVGEVNPINCEGIAR